MVRLCFYSYFQEREINEIPAHKIIELDLFGLETMLSRFHDSDTRCKERKRERERGRHIEGIEKVPTKKTVIHYKQAINHSRNYYSLSKINVNHFIPAFGCTAADVFAYF